MTIIHQIGDVLPGGAAIAGGGLDPEDGFLFPEEEVLVVRTVAKRRREFLAGRSYARRALSRLGGGATAILAEPSRAPRWPAGFTGTISHSASICAAIVARTTDIASIGLDLEGDAPLAADLVPLVCRDEDLVRRDVIERSIGADLAKVVFVVKEAFYKTYFPLVGCFLDFNDVSVTIDPGSCTFVARLTNAARPSFGERRQLSGAFGCFDATLFAVAFVRPSDVWNWQKHER
jgi:4'-phosphopantetheinyl transferase EntD